MAPLKPRTWCKELVIRDFQQLLQQTRRQDGVGRNWEGQTSLPASAIPYPRLLLFPVWVKKCQARQLSESPWGRDWGRDLVMAAVFVGFEGAPGVSSSAQWAEVELVNKDCSREGMWLTSQTLPRHRKQQLRRGPPGSASSCTAYGCDLVWYCQLSRGSPGQELDSRTQREKAGQEREGTRSWDLLFLLTSWLYASQKTQTLWSDTCVTVCSQNICKYPELTHV